MDLCAALELYLHNTFLRAAVPKIDQIDRIAGGVDTNKAERDFHVGGTGLVLDEVKDLKSEGLRTVHMRAGGSAHPQLQLAGGNLWKDFSAKLAADEDEYQAGKNAINKQA